MLFDMERATHRFDLGLLQKEREINAEMRELLTSGEEIVFEGHPHMAILKGEIDDFLERNPRGNP
jgi:hypothetical protein